MILRWTAFLLAIGFACSERDSVPSLPVKRQVAEKSFSVDVPKPAFPAAKGPLILVDEGHNNYHTASGRYYGFAELLRRDGYVVEPSTGAFSSTSLHSCSILVISNALNQKNQGGTDKWQLPTPGAFTRQELSIVKRWVKVGGALLLIADHMPFPGAASDLAREFGVIFTNSFAWNQRRDREIIFRRSDNTLSDHAITNGRSREERVDSVATFTGQAFFSAAGASLHSLLIFGDGIYADFPQKAWEFAKTVPDSSVEHWLQGAVLTYGRGRIAIFGEAAMFTTQKAAATHAPMGFNAPAARQNAQFILNVMHWLSRIID